MIQETRLHEFAGQNADVVIVKRNDDSILVRFESINGYGFPSLELNKLKSLIKICDKMISERND